MLHQAQQHGTHEERLVAVVSDVFDLQDRVAPQQLAEVDRVAALQEPPGRAEAQAGKPHGDEPVHVGLDVLAVADLPDHLPGRPLKIGQARVAGPHVRGPGFTQGQVPPGVLVHPRQRRAEHLREGLFGLEGGEEKGADEVGVGLQGEPVPRLVSRRFQRVQPGGDRIRLSGPDAHDLGSRSREPRRHQAVFSLGGLNDQPWHPGLARGLKQSPDRLGLPAAGRPAHEHVPVQRIQRDAQRPGRIPLPVEHLTQRHPRHPRRRFRAGAGRGGFRGDVKVRAEGQPDSGYFRFRGPGQRRQQPGAGVKRAPAAVFRLRGSCSGRVTGRRFPGVGPGGPGGDGRGGRGAAAEQIPEGSGAGAGRRERIGQPPEIGRCADQARHPGGRRRVGAARQQVNAPHPGRQPLAEFGVPVPQPARLHVPFREAVGHPGGQPFPARGLVGEPLHVQCGQRFRHDDPAERPGPGGQQAFLQRGCRLLAPRRRLPGGHQQPVADPADGAPAGQCGHGRHERAAAQGVPPRPAGESQHHVADAVAARQRRSRGQDLDRAAGPKAHPPVRDRAAGVVGGDQRGDPPGSPWILSLAWSARRRTVRPARDFSDLVRIQPAQFPPRGGHVIEPTSAGTAPSAHPPHPH